MSQLEGAARAYVQFEVLGYLSRRPLSCDTLDGIIDWWLHDQRLTIGRDTIVGAVDDLLAAGAIERRASKIGKPLYAAVFQSPSQPAEE